MQQTPRELREAPRLDPALRPGPPTPRHALLLNPFYPKDPHASFGKHVLTPTLALTSVAGATPPGWDVRLWDENLLQGPPPHEPFPQVVGITVHLTFAERAYELARWYRERGALVVLGGLHVSACSDEAAAHADAIAIGDGVPLWPRILADAERGVLEPVYRADFAAPYRDAPPPRRDLVPRESFLTTASLMATRGCHNRCDFCYLSTRGVRMPVEREGAGAGRGRMARDGRALRRLPRQQPRLRPGAPPPSLPGARAARADLERGRLHRRDGRPAASSARWRSPAARASSSASRR